ERVPRRRALRRLLGGDARQLERAIELALVDGVARALERVVDAGVLLVVLEFDDGRRRRSRLGRLHAHLRLLRGRRRRDRRLDGGARGLGWLLLLAGGERGDGGGSDEGTNDVLEVAHGDN